MTAAIARITAPTALTRDTASARRPYPLGMSAPPPPENAYAGVVTESANRTAPIRTGKSCPSTAPRMRGAPVRYQHAMG
jgi:hypothetical protein